MNILRWEHRKGMKYIIWGSGIRGQRVLHLLGRERVDAFIDLDGDKAGKQCEGVMIYDAEIVGEKFKDCIYVITPWGYEEEIIKFLRNRGINRYIKMGDLQGNITKDNFLKGYTWDIPRDKCALYGIDLYNILLYEYLKKNVVKDVFLIPGEEAMVELIEIISEEYSVISKENVPSGIKIIVPSVQYKKLSGDFDNVECLTSILKRGMPVYNEELSKFKDIHRGKRCFIVATGPSLRIEDLEKLEENKEITFSMNRIYNLFVKTKWRPDYYVIQDYKAIEDLSDEIANLNLPYKFVSYRPESYWNNPIAKESSIRFKLISEKYKEEMPNFSSNIARGIFEGYTVTYACLQIAVYMGFKEIYLIGVDFNYSADVYSDQNHFPGYQSKNKPVRLNEVRPDLVALAYQKARLYGEKHGTKIYNATRGGKLEIFPRAEFDSLF